MKSAAEKQNMEVRRRTKAMKHLLTKGAIVLIVAVTINTVLCTGSAQAVEIDWPEPNWPEIFEPNRLLTFYIEMDPCDWHDIINNHPITDPNVGLRGCLPEEIERPAWFWMEGEQALKIKVAVRRKKGEAFPDENDPCKVALKIDINQYYPEDPNAATEWHGLKKLSLEVNIDAVDAIAEGVAVNIHRMASATEGYGWPVWHANWCKLYVNGVYKGLYANVEQYDKQHLKHRNIYDAHGHTWLYKNHDCEGKFVLRVGDDTYPRSQAVEALCYNPFYSDLPETQSSGGLCSVPDDANVIADMNQWVDMKRMLSSAAIDAFLSNSDPLFEASNNTYFWDPNINEPNLIGKKRLYFPWDVDASFKAYTRDIYYTGSSWANLLLDIPVFRSQYNQIMRDLLAGPLTEENIYALLDTIEPVIAHAISVDPYDKVGDAATQIDTLKTWFSNRIINVHNQVYFDEPQMPPGIVLLNDDFNNVVWDANWTNSSTWVRDDAFAAHELPSAQAPAKASGTFTCVDVNTSDAETVHVDFWLQKDDTETEGDITLYYYNGTSYVNVSDLDTIGDDDEWLHYTDAITDSNYFVSNFKIRFDAVMGNGENVWVDEVVITKELPTGTPCDAANLDGTGLVDFADYALFAPDWQQTGGGLTGDITGNGVVDEYDLAEIALYWLSDCL